MPAITMAVPPFVDDWAFNVDYNNNVHEGEERWSWQDCVPKVINHLRVSKLEYKHSIGEDKWFVVETRERSRRIVRSIDSMVIR